MPKTFDPVGTWIKYGLSDLYFGFRNQESSFYKYGVFFWIMAAEKHLKAILISANLKEIEKLPNLEEKLNAVNKLARKYSHNFEKMVKDVSDLLEKESGERLLPENYSDYNSELLVKSMYEGHMETRYPTVSSTALHYPFESSERIYHDPLGSSFFTDFIFLICERCWKYLATKQPNLKDILIKFEEQYSEHDDFNTFKQLYLSRFNRNFEGDT